MLQMCSEPLTMPHVDEIVPGVGAGKDLRVIARGRAPRHDEGGFILLYVLGTVVMLSIMGLAILSYTFTASKTTGGLSEAVVQMRVTDAAMDKAAQDLRTNPSIVGAAPKTCASELTVYPVPGSTDEIQVSCSDATPFTATSRTMNLLAVRHPQVGADTTAGVARILITDVANNGTPVAGYSIEVCDWLLGSTYGVADLKGCA